MQSSSIFTPGGIRSQVSFFACVCVVAAVAGVVAAVVTVVAVEGVVAVAVVVAAVVLDLVQTEAGKGNGELKFLKSESHRSKFFELDSKIVPECFTPNRI